MKQPASRTSLFRNVQFVTVGLLLRLYSPPPPSSPQLPLIGMAVTRLETNVQLLTFGSLKLLYMPPPASALLELNVQLVTVGLLNSLRIPPPRTNASGFGASMQKPSSTVSGPSPVSHVTTERRLKKGSVLMHVTSGPSELRRVTALPRKLIVSK